MKALIQTRPVNLKKLAAALSGFAPIDSHPRYFLNQRFPLQLALQHGFLPRVEQKALGTLHAQVAKERLVTTGKGEQRIDIDFYI